MNESESLTGKIEVVSTYLKDQDQDINNIELMQSNIYSEVQSLRTEVQEYKGTMNVFIGSNISLSVIILLMLIKPLLSKKHRKE